MSMFNQHDAVICSHYVTTLEYYDISGMEDDEIEQVDAFLDQYPMACFQYGEETSFRRCDISGLMGDCIDVQIFVPKKESK